MSTEFKMKNGSILLVAEAPGGIYNTDQLKAITDASVEFNSTIKVTEEQRLCLFVAADKVSEVSEKLSPAGIQTRPYQTDLAQPVSCIGGLCPHAQQDALDTALRVSEAFPSDSGLPSMSVGLNGCAQTCVPTHTLDISVMGEENGYKVSIGGKNTFLPEVASFLAEGVPASELPDLLSKTFTLFRDNRQENETLFDVVERIGSSQFIEIFAPYSQDAAEGGDDFSFGGELDQIADDFAEIESSSQDVDFGVSSADGSIEDLDADFELDEDISSVDGVDLSADVDLDSEIDLGSDLELNADIELETEVEIGDTEIGQLESEVDLDLGEEADLDGDFTISEDTDLEMGSLDVSDLDSEEIAEEFASANIEDIEELDVESDEVIAEEGLADLELSDDLTPVDLETELSDDEVIEDDMIAGLGEGDIVDAGDEAGEAFEKAFGEDLESHSEMGEFEDENEGDREEALNILETGVAEEIDETDDEILNASDEDFDLDMDGDLVDESFDLESDELDFEDEVSNEPFDSMKKKSSRELNALSQGVISKSWSLAGVDVSENGLSLTFTNGAKVDITNEALGEGGKVIKLGDQTLSIQFSDSDLKVALNGVAFSMPRYEAA